MGNGEVVPDRSKDESCRECDDKLELYGGAMEATYGSQAVSV